VPVAPPPRPDPDAIAQSFAALCPPGGILEVRVPVSKPDGPSRLRGVASGYFSDSAKFVETVKGVTGADAVGVFATINAVDPRLVGRAANRLVWPKPKTTTDADVIRLRHLLIDVDPNRPSGIGATDDERAADLAVRKVIGEALRDAFDWPSPAMLTESGNGAALLYAVDLPNDPTHVALLRDVLAALGAMFDTAAVHVDATTYRPAQTTRVPGSINAKGDTTVDRPWRLATTRFNPGDVVPVPIDRLHAVVDAVTVVTASPSSPSANGGHPGQSARTWDIRDILVREEIGFTEKQSTYATVLTLDRCLTSDDHRDGACILEFPNGALSYTCRHNSCAGKRWEDVRTVLGLATSTTPALRPTVATSPPPPTAIPSATTAKI
jgi:hypothetical protein